VRTFGDVTIDPVGRDVWLAGEPVALTRTEFDLLSALSERPRMAFSRRQLIDQVWGENWVGDEHLVDVHIGHLRRKLGDDATGRFIRTVRGIGYRMGTGQ
jgi:DNA-binding response OmpR family regulator